MRDNGACRALALVLALAGCEEEAPEAAPSAAPSATAAPAAAPLVELEAPAEVLAFGEVSPATLATAAERLGLFGMDEVGRAVAERVGLTDASILDPGRSPRFALLDGPRGTNELALLLPITTPEKVAIDGEALGEGRWIRRGGALHLRLLDRWLMVCADPAALETPWASRFARATGGSATQAILEPGHVLAGRDDRASLARAISGFIRLVDLGRTSFTAVATDGGWRIAVDAWGGLPGTAPLPPPASSLLADVPAEAAAVVIAHAPAGDLALTLARWLLQLAPREGVGEEALRAFVAAGSGQVALFAVPSISGGGSADGLQLAGVAGVKDAEATRKAQRDLHQGQRAPDVAAVHRDLGVVLRARRDAYRVGEQAVDVVETVLSPGRPEPHDLERAFGASAAVFADLLTTHVAVGEDRLRVAYGADAKPWLSGWLEGGWPRSFADTPAAAELYGEGEPFLVAAVDLRRILRAERRDESAKKQTAEAAPAPSTSASATPPLPPEAPIRVAATTDADRTRLVIDLPTEQAKALVQMFQRRRTKKAR